MTRTAQDRARERARRAFPVVVKCEHCAAIKRLERHHPDISEPLAIIVLCKGCHIAEHKRMGGWGGRPNPGYIRVAAGIEARIRSGELRPGDKLPSEHAIAAEFEVAYSTARRAMKELRDRGLISTVWGKGTFVAQLKEERWPLLSQNCSAVPPWRVTPGPGSRRAAHARRVARRPRSNA